MRTRSRAQPSACSPAVDALVKVIFLSLRRFCFAKTLRFASPSRKLTLHANDEHGTGGRSPAPHVRLAQATTSSRLRCLRRFCRTLRSPPKHAPLGSHRPPSRRRSRATRRSSPRNGRLLGLSRLTAALRASHASLACGSSLVRTIRPLSFPRPRTRTSFSAPPRAPYSLRSYGVSSSLDPHSGRYAPRTAITASRAGFGRSLATHATLVA